MNDKLTLILSSSKGKSKKPGDADILGKITKIEKLTAELKSIQSRIIEVKQVVDSRSKSVKQDYLKLKLDVALELMNKYSLKSFNNKQRECIKGIVEQLARELYENNYISDELDIKFKNFFAAGLEKLTGVEKEFASELMKDAFEQMGISVEDFSLEDLQDPDFFDKLKDKYINSKSESEERFKQENEMKKNETTDGSFHKIYKKLVKLAHPDLAQTDEDKHRRDAQMKKLTAAWEVRDYYELLTLWSEIDPENSIKLQDSEVNIKSMLLQLNRKINQLQGKLYGIKFMEPETSFYYEKFCKGSDKKFMSKIDQYIYELQLSIKETQAFQFMINDTKSFKSYLNRLIKEDEEFGDFFDDLDGTFY